MRILISAGEASGEMYGAQLIEAVHKEFGSAPDSTPSAQDQRRGSTGQSASPGLEFFGVGGDKMRAAGCRTVVHAEDLAVVGITEILSHLPKIWGLFQRLIAEADAYRPDLAIVIDSPAFNWRVARQMKKRGVPVIYYVCPQFWAWRQGRVKLLRKYVDKALVIFPFEEKFYRERGVNAEFVGHPLAELARPAISREQYAERYKLDPAKPWITLMPGSRGKEVRMNLPTIVRAAQRLDGEHEFLLPVAPTLDSGFVQEIVAQGGGKQTGIHLVPEALPALAHSRAGIVASGTATVEAALMETPFVMVYQVTPLTYWLGRWTVKVPHFAMVNLIAGQRIVPEFVQQEFTAENVAAAVKAILEDGEARQQMLQGLREVRRRLGSNASGKTAPERAAEAIAAFVRGV